MYKPFADNEVVLNHPAVKRVLWILDDNEFYLGDNCIILYRLARCKPFFGDQVTMDINFVNERYLQNYLDICRNNPHFNNLLGLPLADISYHQYDLVICISTDETVLQTVLLEKYPEQAMFPPACTVCSFSKAVFFRRKNIKAPVFPFHHQLFEYAEQLTSLPNELYVSAGEKEWGTQWLEANGISKQDELYIIVDNASHRHKLIKLEVYYKLLSQLLEHDHARVLIFDENNIGKEQFYKEWLEEEHFNKLIFANGLSLRKALCIVSSDHIKMVFGPCTGLLHCASGIYNNFQRQGLAVDPPAIIVYTGPWDAHFWWHTAPLVDCLLLKDEPDGNRMFELNELSEAEQKEFEGRLDCNKYRAETLVRYIETRMAARIYQTTE